jgi:hypothetical protein
MKQRSSKKLWVLSPEERKRTEEQIEWELAKRKIELVEKEFEGTFEMREVGSVNPYGSLERYPRVKVIAKYYGRGEWILSGYKIINSEMGPKQLVKHKFFSISTSEIAEEISVYFLMA